MAAETEEWVLKLVDQASGSAARMSAGLGALDSAQLKTAASAIALDKVQKAAGARPAPRGADGKFLKKGSEEYLAAIAAATVGTGQMAGVSAAAGNAMEKTSGGLDKLKTSALGLASTVGTYVVAAATAAAGALIAMGVAAVSFIQQKAQLLATFTALGGGAAQGKATAAIVAKLGDQLPVATSKLAEWAQGLQRAGIQGKELDSAVRAIAAAAALNPEGGAAAAQETLSKLASGGKEATDLVKAVATGSRKGTGALREMGLTLADLGGKTKVAKMSAVELAHAMEKALQAKGAGKLAQMGLDAGVMFGKLKEGAMSLFGGLAPAVTPFMLAIKSLFGSFSKGTPEMAKLRATVTAVMTPLFSIATSVATVLKSMFAGFGGKAQSASGGLVAMLNAAAKFAASKEGMAQIKSVFEGIGTAIGIVSTIFGVLWTVAKAVATSLYQVFVAPVVAIVGFISQLSGAQDALVEWASGAVDAAANFVSGLVGGIVAGAASVITAVKGLASGALSAFTGALGIHSPSTIMLRHGEENIAGAAATGVERGADKMDASMERLGAPPKGSGAGARGGSGGGPLITFNNCSFGGEDSESTIREVIEKVWAELASSAAEPVPS